MSNAIRTELHKFDDGSIREVEVLTDGEGNISYGHSKIVEQGRGTMFDEPADAPAMTVQELEQLKNPKESARIRNPWVMAGEDPNDPKWDEVRLRNKRGDSFHYKDIHPQYKFSEAEKTILKGTDQEAISELFAKKRKLGRSLDEDKLWYYQDSTIPDLTTIDLRDAKLSSGDTKKTDRILGLKMLEHALKGK